MLKVTIELWPFGDDTRRTVIAEAEIWNDGDHPYRPMYGNYKGVFHTDGAKQRYLRVEDHPRGLGAWVLLGKFLKILPRAKPLPVSQHSPKLPVSQTSPVSQMSPELPVLADESGQQEISGDDKNRL